MDKQKLIEIVNTLFENELYAEVLTTLSVLDLREFSSPELYIVKARSNQRLSHFDSAIADLTDAILLFPKNAEIWYRRGNAWTEKADFNKAIEDFNTAISLDPNHSEAFMNRGYSWGSIGEHKNAIADFSEAI